SPPIDLTARGQQARLPRVVLDGNGRAVATWIGGASGARVPQSSALTLSSGLWTAPVALTSTPGAEFTGESSDLALNAFGVGAAVWVRRSAPGDGSDIPEVARYDGVRYSTPVALAAAAATALHPRVAVDAAGNILVVWVATGATTSVVRSRRFDVETSLWQAPRDLSVDGSNVTGAPVLAMDDEGNAIAAWARADGRVQTRRFTIEDAVWSAVVDISPSGETATEPRLAMSADGTAATLVWKFVAGTQGIRAVRRDAENNTWFPSDVLMRESPGIFDPVVAIDAAGLTIAAWVNSDGSFRNLQTKRHNGVAWEVFPQFRTTGVDASTPDIHMDALGNAALVWVYRSGQQDLVQASMYDAVTDRWSVNVEVSQRFRGNAAVPRVRLDGGGDAVAVWQSDGDYASVQASTFAFSESPRLQPATVNGPFVTLSWSPPTAGNPPSAYVVVARTVPDGPIIASLPMGLRLTETVYAPDGTYFVRVQAIVDGEAIDSNEVAVVVGFGPPPTPPTSVEASAVDHVITIKWAPPVNADVAIVQTYVIEAGSERGLSNLAWFATGGTETSYVAGGIPNGAYWIRLRAQSAGGLSLPSDDVLLLVGPRPPGAPALSPNVHGDRVTLSWTVAAAPGAPVTGYQLRAGYSPGASNAAVVAFGPTQTAYAAESVPAGTYYVRVVPLSAAGPGVPSNEVTLVVASPPEP
ncbi:MAG: fibronectin type III domain-containing protein, partial [Acidobacteria bacterium]|nr:fibronectin type III domain-containing protein [Acidobacteriota bacterium]